MIKYIDYICAVLVRLFNLFFHFLPIRFTLWLGRRCGALVYFVNRTRKIIGYANLRAAFCKDKSPRELKRLVKNVYKNLTQVFFEVLSLTKVNARFVEKYIDIVNPENMYKIAGNPHGIILLTAHFGNWELSGVVSAVKGFPPIVLAREQSMKRLNELINKLRESKGLQVVRKGITTKYIVKALHKGKIIGMLGDQDAGKTGVFTELFGRPVSTAPGVARIASRTGAFILPAFMARVKGPYHRLILEEPIKVKKGEAVEPYLSEYNKLLEKYVTMYPDQWLWLHKRWKSSPLKKVIILNDGKAGHLNQALAFLKLLKKYRKDSGYGPEDTRAEIIEIKFKNNFLKILLQILSLFASPACQGCMRCLEFCLREASYKNLMRIYGDIIISCGSNLASVNRFFAIENNAKCACLMKPSMLGLNKFDMVVLPWHDGKKGSHGEVVVTDTVLNSIDEEYLNESSRKISEVTILEKPKRIGVLLGGDNSDFALTEETTEILLDNIVDASNKLDTEILFTTSRRTPKTCEHIVRHRLMPEKRCKLLVIANEKNIPHTVGGILGLADTVVVSCESASMVSEAIASGKKVLVFKLKKRKKKNSKFEKMLDYLEGKGYVIVAKVDELSRAIERFYSAPHRQNLPQDQYNVYKYMWRLL